MPPIHVTILHGAHVYSPTRADCEFTGDQRLKRVFEVEVWDDETGTSSTFGPYVLVDAIAYAQSAARQPDPSEWLRQMDRRHHRAEAGNDWNGMIPGMDDSR